MTELTHNDANTAQSEPAIKSPLYTEIGEYTSFALLSLCGGKFYTMDDKVYCDTPLASFVGDSSGFRRIE
jgi:hypothetical protein